MISDRELAELALAADPDIEIDPDAPPFEDPTVGSGLLPEWYMPAPQRVARTPIRMAITVGVILSLLIVNGAGLCVTYGWPEIAW